MCCVRMSVVSGLHIQRWSHKIIMDCKQKNFLPCWKKSLGWTKMLNLLLDHGGLNRGGRLSVLSSLLVCLRLGPELARVGEEGSPELTYAYPCTYVYPHTQTPLPSVSLSFISVSFLTFPLSLTSFPFCYFPSQALSESLDFCSAFLSSVPLLPPSSLNLLSL